MLQVLETLVNKTHEGKTDQHLLPYTQKVDTVHEITFVSTSHPKLGPIKPKHADSANQRK